jgi:hypothetical protein
MAPELNTEEDNVNGNTSAGEVEDLEGMRDYVLLEVGSAHAITTISLSMPGALCLHNLYHCFQSGCALARESRPLIHRALANPVKPATIISSKDWEMCGEEAIM